MSRNMIGANNALFRKIKAKFPNIQQDPTRRYLLTTNEERRWLRDCKLTVHGDLEFSDIQAIYLCQFADQQYFITKNIPKLSSPHATPIAINAGLFVAAVSELPIGVRIGITELDVLNSPLREFYDGESKAGFDLEEITPYFDELAMYQIPTDSPLLQESTAIRVGIIATIDRNSRLYHLALRECSLQEVEDAVIKDTKNLPIRLLLRALHERRWEHAFLSIYKCLEQLFPLFKIEELRGGLASHLESDAAYTSSQIKLFDLAALAETHLGWRAHEEDAMHRLFLKLPDHLVEELACYLGIAEDDQEKKCRKVAEMIYKIRNSSVHFRPGHSKNSRSVYPANNDYWESVFVALLKMVIHLYDQYGDELLPEAY